MDKAPFQNEGTSPEELKETQSGHSILVKTKKIDVGSLPQKTQLSDSEKDKDHLPSGEQLLDENWLLLSRDWQTQPYEKTDVNALLKQTLKRTFWAKSLLILNIVATIGVIIGFFIGLYQGDWAKATLVYLGVCSVASIVFVYYEIKIRAKTWQQNCDSPDKAIVNAISGCESSIKYVRLLKLSSWLMLPLMNGYLIAASSESEKSLWPPLIIINLCIVIMWGVSHWFHLKRNKELKQLLML